MDVDIDSDRDLYSLSGMISLLGLPKQIATNQVTQITKKKMDFPMVLEARSPKPRCWQNCSFLETLREDPSHASLPAPLALVLGL